MSMEIKIEHLNKCYGRKQALRDVNLEIHQGMFGLLGRNGAGKSTLMKILSTLLVKNSGEVSICGIPVEQSSQIRRMTGYLPQDFSVYPNMKIYEAMDYLGVLSGISAEDRKRRIPKLLEQVNLQQDAQKKVKALSGGMKRRLGIAQAILHNPKVLIVDEPTAGLDPEERVRFRNLLSELAEDRIVILSTHIVGDVEATCEDIAVLDEGSILFQGQISQLLEVAEGLVYTAEVDKEQLAAMKREYAVTSMVPVGSKMAVRFLAGPQKQVFAAARPCEPGVEDAYMYLMQTRGGER